MPRFASLLLPLALAVLPLAGGATGSPSAHVVAVENAGVADLVLLDAGFSAGFRQGMVCRVVRDGAEIAEVLLVGIRPAHSAALILTGLPRHSIRAGDTIHLKLLKT